MLLSTVFGLIINILYVLCILLRNVSLFFFYSPPRRKDKERRSEKKKKWDLQPSEQEIEEIKSQKQEKILQLQQLPPKPIPLTHSKVFQQTDSKVEKSQPKTIEDTKQKAPPKVERIVVIKPKVKKESSKTKVYDSKHKQRTTEKKEKEVKQKQTTVEEVEAEKKRIEEEMSKRKERMAAWRAARQKEEDEAQAKLEEERKQRKEWTLDDDDDEEDENDKMEVLEEGKIGEDEVDPLDAFMLDLDETPVVKEKPVKQNSTTNSSINGTKKGPTFVTVTKVKGQMLKQMKTRKGELMQNDQDAVEYSDEEEGDSDLASALSNIMKKNKRKELPAVDHKKVEYQHFRKDFYKEVPELARMTPEEVSAYRIELENVKVKGKNCPKPVKSWAQCGMSSKVLDVLKKNDYEKPTPIQAQAIPAIMSGRDLIGIAKTGSGKTLAFLLPMFRHVLDQPPLDFDDGPIALIFSPTRELAIQIYNECKKFCKPLKLKTVCVYGGAGVSEQIADLKRGAEIVVCTPGRMIDVLAANSGRVTNLHRITYIVLDEADRMFDMGFEPQVMRIIGNMRPDKQTVMFSATFPRQMEALARKILNQPIEVQVGGRSVVCKEVEQTVVVLEEHQKFLKLLELLGRFQEEGSVLVFVERQESADYLVKDLMRAMYPCMALHGGMDQSDRDSTLADFRNGVTTLLVATSVAARGLDVKRLILVINYDCPNHYEDYVHRCGRTGRAGNKGNAYTFITPDQAKYSGEIIKALELSETAVPDDLNELWKSFTEQMKTEGKYKPRRRVAGFSGKGFKFNEEEDAKTLERKLKQKDSLGLADSDDEDQYAILTMEKKLEEVFSGKPRKIDPNAPQIPIVKPNQQLNKQATKNLAKAAAIAGKIMSNKNIGPGSSVSVTQEAASNVMKGEEVSVTGAALASQIAASINAKVGAGKAKVSKAFLPAGVVLPSAGRNEDDDDSDDDILPKHDLSLLIRWEEDIDINDFPQQIRFRITTRDVLDEIGEYSDSYISVRGLYVPPTKLPKEADSNRLRLLIEAKSERSVSLAKQEIKHLVKEEAEKLATRSYSKQKGRYTV